MTVKVNEIMVSGVMTTTASQTTGHVRKVMTQHRISSLPVVNPGGEAVGIVTARDLLGASDTRSVGQVMSRKLHTVPQHADVSLAARIMRNHRIHHVVVVHEKKVVGILSSFDLLRLVEEHRFVMKNAPTPKKHRRLPGGRREVIIDGTAE